MRTIPHRACQSSEIPKKSTKSVAGGAGNVAKRTSERVGELFDAQFGLTQEVPERSDLEFAMHRHGATMKIVIAMKARRKLYSRTRVRRADRSDPAVALSGLWRAGFPIPFQACSAKLKQDRGANMTCRPTVPEVPRQGGIRRWRSSWPAWLSYGKRNGRTPAHSSRSRRAGPGS